MGNMRDKLRSIASFVAVGVAGVLAAGLIVGLAGAGWVTGTTLYADHVALGQVVTFLQQQVAAAQQAQQRSVQSQVLPASPTTTTTPPKAH